MTELGRVLGVDHGSVRIGIAVSDPLRIAASPHSVVAVDGSEAGEVAELAAELGVELVIVGLPTTLSGVEGESALAARAFAVRLAEDSGLIVEFADERFTTKRAEQLLAATTRDRRDRRERVDAVAASVMLQGWLDAEAARRRGNPRYQSPD